MHDESTLRAIFTYATEYGHSNARQIDLAAWLPRVIF